MSKMSEENSEVFDQPEKKAGAMEPDGPVPNRSKEEGWWEATEPYHGARSRATDFDRPVDIGLGATMGGLEENVERRDSEVPKLPPEKGGGDTDATAGRNRPNNEWSPVAALEDTVSRMQRDLEELQTENRYLRTPRAPVPVPLVRQAALTTTKVPWFNGSTSWEQYRQVFDAIVLSNGWGDATAALQLLSHLQDDALSVALLVPMPLRASRRELTDALSSHYGSPGRLANYRREFDTRI